MDSSDATRHAMLRACAPEPAHRQLCSVFPKINFRPLLRCLASATLMGLICAASTATEGAGYALVTGKQYPLCREFLQTLQSFPERTVAFDWPVERESKNFRRPTWHPVSAIDHLDIVEKIYRARRDGTSGRNPLSDEDTARVWQQIRAKVLDEITSGIARLEQSRLDFNNDGREEQAFRYGRRVYPVSENLRTLTGERPLLGWWYWFEQNTDSGEKPWPLYGDTGLYDIFFYKGRTYFARYSYDLFRIGTITDYVIFEPQAARAGLGLSMTAVCLFSYPEQ